MRSLLLSVPSPRLARRVTARSASRAAAALRPHAPVLRLVLLFALAFLLAFYLDARDAAGSTPPISLDSSVAPDVPVRTLPTPSAPLVERGRLNL